MQLDRCYFLWVTFKIKSVDIKSKFEKTSEIQCSTTSVEITFGWEREILKAVEHFRVQLQCIITEKFAPGVAVILIHGESSQLTGRQMWISICEMI